MNTIYFMSELQQLFLLGYACLLVIAQAHIFCLAFDVHRQHKKIIFAQESIILGFVFIAALSMSIPIISLLHGDISLGRYNILRLVFGFLGISTAFWGLQTKITKLLLVTAIILALPWTDNCLVCLLFSLLLWTIRAYFVFKRIIQLRQEQITPSAIKEAMDSLPVGMIFAYENGEIFLTNVAALKYMYGCFHHYFGDIATLWEASIDYPSDKCLEKKIMGKDLFIRLTPSCSLLLSFTILDTPHNKILQMLIKNVTEEALDTLQLHKQNVALASSGIELKTMLRNLENVTRQQVATKLRFYIHDLMGQRLTILQQLLYEERTLNFEKFIEVLDEVSSDMHKIEVQSPENKLNNILTTYKNIGISIQTAGSLPHDKALAETFVAIIREGITNAIRHGHCTKVQIQMLNEHNKDILNITDNGIGCSKSPVFGTGLTRIATRLEAFNGILKIKVQPAFTIHCEVQSNHD